MNTSLYECHVMHYRLEPKKNRFVYKLFMFSFDLDEIDSWAKRLWLLSRNRFNLFSFRDSDHLQRGFKTAKENILDFVASKGVHLENPRIVLLTHLRMFGHFFNPVCFYFCFDRPNDKPLCVVAELTNTYREMKPYLLGPECLRDGEFDRRVVKNFYVSPFMDLDAEFDFRLQVPGEAVNLYIDDYKQGKKVLLSSVTGRRVPLSDGRLMWYILRFPVITLQVITLIHWQALVLWLKRVPHIKKAANPELQQEVYNARH